MSQITIYTTSTSHWCGLLKEYLSSLNANFTEKLIDDNDSAREELLALSNGYMGVPFTHIVGQDLDERIIGFDKAKLESILKK